MLLLCQSRPQALHLCKEDNEERQVLNFFPLGQRISTDLQSAELHLFDKSQIQMRHAVNLLIQNINLSGHECTF